MLANIMEMQQHLLNVIWVSGSMFLFVDGDFEVTCIVAAYE